MRDDYSARSPDRGRHRNDHDNMGASRGRDGQDRQDDHYRSRHDFSRSPPRHNFYDDQRERAPQRRRPDMSGGRDYDDRYHGPDDGHRRRDRSPRQRSRHWDDRDHSYENMYDEGHRAESKQSGRYDDDERGGDDYAHRDGRRGRPRSPHGGHYRSRSRSRTRDAGKPTDTVILEGLPYSISSVELRDGLLANSIAAEFPSIDVRVSSSKGSRRAFVQFEDVDQATAFVKEHFPKILIELQHSTDDAPDGKFEAYIHYARNRDEGETRQARALLDWNCPQCEFFNFSTRTICKICGAPQPTAPNWEQSLTGAADVADGAEAVSQILVVYPLASFVTEEMLAKDLKQLEKSEEPKSSTSGPTKLKSTAPGADVSRYGGKPCSLHRVFLMRETSSGESFKYGFAEFWTLEDAAAAVTKFRMSRAFNVAGCAVTVAPTHMGVFLPEDREITPNIEHMSFNPLFNPSLRVRYRDTHVFPSQLVVTSEPPADTKPGASKSTEDQQGDKKQKKRKAEGNLAAATVKKSVPMIGQMAVWQRKHDELRGVDEGGGSNGQSDPALKSDPKAPIKISLSNSTKLGAPSSLAPRQSSPSEKLPETEAPAQTTPPNEALTEPSSAPSPTKEETYMDRERLMCLICMRKYKSLDEVNIHEKSRNHKTAMDDDEKVQAALPRLTARDKRLQNQGDASSATQYRDRAKERRDIYNQPNRPASQPAKPKSSEVKKPVEESKPPAKVASKGAGMLAKMGWTSGSGLGANGDGRTEAIATNAYQEGVGLGADGSNLGDAAELAEKKTTGTYSDYLSSVQDKARERYNQMN